MNKSAIIIGVITLVIFGACQDYEPVAYTKPERPSRTPVYQLREDQSV